MTDEIIDQRLQEQRLAQLWADAFDSDSLVTVLDALYAHEINVGMQSFWDAGWTVWFGAGHAWSDVKAEETFEPNAIDEIVPWLKRTTEDLYPVLKQSRYDLMRREATVD